MISFKQIELSDKSKIDCCLQNNNFRACDFSFANLFAWSVRFKTQYAIVHKTLFLRIQDEDGQFYYMMPIGQMSAKDAIHLIRSDAETHKMKFRMKGVTAEIWDIVRKEMPSEFEYIPDRDNSEYIYLSEKLITLSGKKLQSKRNHINRFKLDNPDWEYFPLTSRAELEDCVRMLDEWEDFKDDSEKSLRYDYLATKMMLDHFEELELTGGAIKVNGRIIAFTLGERLTDDTFVVHVEKAFAGINGAYTIINQQFVEHAASEFKYINREEDMGIESLRKAKLSYKPDILLEEGILIPKK